MPELLVWTYNPSDGALIPMPTAIAVVSVKTLGWKGPFKTEKDARDFYEKNKAANPKWKEPTKDPIDVALNTPDAVTGGVKVPSIGSGLSNIDIQSWLIRIGEILLGIVLIGVGVAKLTNTPNVISKAVKMK